MRVDANVSVRPVGATELGTKVEVKNMNSLRSLGRAIEYEIERQIDALETGERIVQETRHWDEADGRTHSMRSKEGSSDYRYFPEPDLVPVAPTDEMRAAVRGVDARAARQRAATRLQEEWGISESEARIARRHRGPGRLRRGGGRRARRRHAARRRELGERRRARPPQRDRAVAGGAAARARRAGRARRPRRRRHDLAQPGQGRARRVPAPSPSARSRSSRSAGSRR